MEAKPVNSHADLLAACEGRCVLTTDQKLNAALELIRSTYTSDVSDFHATVIADAAKCIKRVLNERAGRLAADSWPPERTVVG